MSINPIDVETASDAREPLSSEDVLTCVRVLLAIDADRGHLARLSQEQRRELLTLAGRVAKPDRHSIVQMRAARFFYIGKLAGFVLAGCNQFIERIRQLS